MKTGFKLSGVWEANSQAKNRRLLAGFAVLFAAAIFSFTLAGCDDGSGDDGGTARWPDTFTTFSTGTRWRKDGGYYLTFKHYSDSTPDSVERDGYSDEFFVLQSVSGDRYTVIRENSSGITYTFRAVIDTTDGKLRIAESEWEAFNGTWTKQ
jgi:hypothetical protein